MSTIPPARPVPYAGLGKRTLAAFLDNLVWLFAIVQIAGLIPDRTYDDEPLLAGAIFLLLLSAWFNYFWLAEWRWGKTIGKAIVSIHVAAEDGGRPSLGAATVRNLLRTVDVLGIGPILIATSQRRQRLGDRAARTVVVRDKAAEQAPAAATPEGLPPVASGAASASGRRSPWRERIGIPPRRWSPAQVVWGVLAVVGLLTVQSFVVAAFDPDLDSLASNLTVQGLLALNLFAVAIGFAALRPSTGGPSAGPFQQLGLRGFAASALGVAALTYFAYIVFAVIYASIVEPEQEDFTRELGLDEGGIAAFVAGALIVVAAPISEEVFFRGFMYGGLRRRMPMWAAAILSGLVFGLLHYTGPDSIGVVPQLAVLGVLLAWLYERTGSLWPPVLLHALNNGIALAVLTST